MLRVGKSFVTGDDVRKSVSKILVLCAFLPAALGVAADARFRSGMPLTEALLQLQQRGLKLVFSSQVVRPEMRVQVKPASQELRPILDELLTPHGLGVMAGPGDVLIVVSRRTSAASLPLRELADSSPILAEEIVVQPSRISLLVEEPAAPITLSREEIQSLPHLGDDVFRAVSLLPGTSSNDISAQFHIRGGRRDELLILLDGQELYEPFHLRDFDNALSIISASALARVHLITAAFPVSYGDRMAGVMEMATTAPTHRHARLAASILGAQIEASDTYSDGRLGWFTSLRRGTTDLLGRALSLEQPSFWDFFGKLEAQLTARQSVRLHGLASRDNLDFAEEEDQKQLDTQYDNTYFWLTHRSILAEYLFVDTTASTTRVRRDRRGVEDDGERAFRVRDERHLDVTGLLQSWNLQAGPRHFVNLGVEYQKFDALYDYFSLRDFDTPLARIRTEPADGTFALDDNFISEHLSLYGADRVRLSDSLVIDFGIRYDRQTSVDDNLLSPRISAAWAFRPRSVLRLGWGHYHQSHRAYELMVEDGDALFYPAERSEHRVIGFEHLFAPASHIPLSAMRVEVYQRQVENPRPRYENLLKPFDPFPEGDFDRVRIEPESATAQGVELLLRGRSVRRIDWWLNYALASTEDRINGRDVPRGIDQTHSLNLDVNYHIGAGWKANAAWVYRTGRPTTPLTLRITEGPDGVIELSPVLGERNSSRLPHYERLDLRVSREWQIGAGTLTFFLDAHDAYNHRNVSGLDVEIDEERAELVFDEEHWPGFFASAGISWEFR